MNTISPKALYLTACLLALLCSGPSHAQQATSSAVEVPQQELGEIVVTARKRQESSLDVPVIENIIQPAQIESLAVVDLTELPTLVPGLVVGHYEGGLGAQTAIRGVGSVAEDQGIDQSVGLNIDGMSLNNGTAMLSGLFDLQQVEVLKGPQSLFYGKSTTAGVISIRTADPTEKTEVITQAGYDFVAKNPRAELILSGPVTDTLKLRLSGMYSHSEGYFDNLAMGLPPTGSVDPRYENASNSQNFIIRGTAVWTPSSQFDARAKVNWVEDLANDADTAEILCPGGIASPPPFPGIPFYQGSHQCGLGRNLWNVDMNPAAFDGLINNSGSPFRDTYQQYYILEMNYRPIDHLALSSTTAYYHDAETLLANATDTSYAAPAIAGQYRLAKHQFTEEVRLTSDFATPLNYMLGAFYENGNRQDRISVFGNTFYGLPPILFDNEPQVGIITKSVYGQLRWKVVPQVELAAGARWTEETRTESAVAFSTTAYSTAPPTNIPVVVPQVHSNNVYPDFTATYKPTEDRTFFAAFKEAYKSGSFTLGQLPGPNGLDNAVGPEKAIGGEVGIKTLMLEQHLLLNAATYYYHYTGLQVGIISPTVNGVPTASTENAGSARTYGIDLDAAYRPANVNGLQVNGALNWNKATYVQLDSVPCWGGQTIGQGCNQLLNPTTGLYTAQNLNGTPMVRAPEWTLNFGFDYKIPVNSELTMALSNNNAYSSNFLRFLAINFPGNASYQNAYFKSDLSLALQGPSNRWEVALIGNNIFNKVIASACANADLQQGAIFSTQVTGAAVKGAAPDDDVSCYPEAGRALWLRFTYRPL